MDIGSILLIMAVALVVAVYIARPFLAHQGVAVTEAERELSALEAERERVLAVIQEMDMDYTMGKIAPEDYQAQRKRWVSQGAGVLKQIDALVGEASSGLAKRGKEIPLEGDLEAELEAAVDRLRKVGKGEAAAHCTKCGQRIIAGDKFCSGCGQPVPPGAGK